MEEFWCMRNEIYVSWAFKNLSFKYCWKVEKNYFNMIINVLYVFKILPGSLLVLEWSGTASLNLGGIFFLGGGAWGGVVG